MRSSIFLDTGVIKACLDTRLMLLPECKKIMWAGHEIEATVHRPVYINQNLYFLRQGNRARFEDTVALRFIAALAKEGKIELQMQGEVFHELMGLPGAMDDSPLFHGAPITTVAGPVQYGRIVADGFGTDYQYEFLVSLTHSRFQALQKVCGAFQGHGRPLHRNQLIDAFHVWCAESSRATYFLTHDDKLVSALNRARRPARV